MPEEVLFESEQYVDRGDVASYLRTVANRLDAGEPVSLDGGGQSITVSPPSTVEFEVKVEREGPSGGPGELALELELEWDENAPEHEETGGLAIE